MNHSIQDEFISSLKNIAIPVALQNLLFTSLNFVDTLMVSSLGTTAFSGVGLSGQYVFLTNLAIFGIIGGVQIFTTQYFGDGNLKQYRKCTGLAMFTSFMIALCFSLPAFLAPDWVLQFFSKDTEVLAAGRVYLKIIAFQMPLFAIAISLASASRASKNAKLPLKISAVSLCSNTLLNYLLIFGKFGFPKLGVQGAAIATTMSSGISVLQYLFYLRKDSHPLHGKLSDFLHWNREFLLPILVKAWPVFLHEVLWSLGLTIYVSAFSNTNTEVYAAYQVMNQFIKFVFILAVSVSSAASITIGNQLGSGDIDSALLFEKKYSKLQLLLSIGSAILMLFIAHFAIPLFKVDTEVQHNAFRMLLVAAFFLPFRFYNGMMAAGILRAGGDTTYPVILELSGIYLVNVPLAFLALRVLDLSYPAVIALSSTGDLVVMLLLYFRVRSQKWAKNLVSPKLTPQKS